MQVFSNMAGVHVQTQGDPVYVYGHPASVASSPTISGSLATLFDNVSQLHPGAALCSMETWWPLAAGILIRACPSSAAAASHLGSQHSSPAGTHTLMHGHPQE